MSTLTLFPFHLTNLKLCTCETTLHFPGPRPPAATILLSVSVNLTILQISSKWNHTALVILWLVCGSDSKTSACNAGDLGSIPGLGRSPGEGSGNPLQYSRLENSMDQGAWGATVLGLQRVGHNWVTHTLFLCYFTSHNILKFHWCWSVCQNFLPFKGWKYSIVWIHHALFIHSSPFWLLWITLLWAWVHQYLFKTLPSALLSVHPQMELHESHGNLLFIFWETAILFSTTTPLACSFDSHFPNDNSDVENLCMCLFEYLFGERNDYSIPGPFLTKVLCFVVELSEFCIYSRS